jgi:hypothetical protein
MAMKAISDGKQVLLACNENIPELTNAKKFLYNDLKNKGYCETMGITEHTPLSRMINLLTSFIPYAEPHLYIYNQGYLNTTIIGGEEFKTSKWGSFNYFHFRYDEDYIESKANANGTATGNFQCLSHIKIPTSQYNTLKIEYQMLGSGTQLPTYLSIKVNDTGADIKSVTLETHYEPVTATMDISDIDYDTYFSYRYTIQLKNTHIRIYRIWMEK